MDFQEIFPGGVNSPVRRYDPHPLIIKKARGPRIMDISGRWFTDYCLAFGPMILGHSDPAVRDEVIRQIDDAVLTGTPTLPELNLAREIKEAIPHMEKIRFANSGSEAVLHSLRVARAFSGRKKVLKFNGCYHGANDYSLVRNSDGSVIPSSPGIPGEVSSTVILSEYGDRTGVERIIREKGYEIGAVIIEPVMANVGVIPPDPEFLIFLREICNENDIPLIMDEVITGFRMRYGTYSQMLGVKPDLTVLSKIVGGGFPLSAFGGRKEIMDIISPEGPVYVAGTFSGNPVSCAAGFATLKELKKKDYNLLNRMVEEISEDIVSYITSSGKRYSFNSFGTMFQLFFSPEASSYSSILRSDRDLYMKFFRFMLERGIYVEPSQTETNFLSFSHSDEDINALRDSIKTFLRSLK